VSIRQARLTTCRVSLYCLDFDKLSRSQRVEISAGERKLDSQNLEKMDTGVWLHYEITGSVDITFQNTNAPYNAVLAGIFFDTPEELKVAKRQPIKGPVAEGGLKPGVWAEYFDLLPVYSNVKDRPLVRRAEKSLAFGDTPPLPQPEQGLRGWPLAGACAAVFAGVLKVPENGAYTFFLESDDGSRLYLDGELLVDNDGKHGMREASAKAELSAGCHRIWLEYFNAGGPMGLNVHMTGKDGKKLPIPEVMLWHDPAEVLQANAEEEDGLVQR